MEASTNEFDWRWTVRALRSHGLLPQWLRHFNLALVDEVYEILWGQGGGQKALPGWRRTKLMKAPLLRHGFDYGLEAQRRADASPPVARSTSGAMSEAAWLGSQLGSPRPLRTQRTAQDVDVLMAEGTEVSGEQLIEAACENGLYLSPSAAASFTEDVVKDERARAQLEAAGYAHLKQALRRRELPRPTALPLATGTTTGGDELPGPMATMAPALREPKQLEMDEDNGDDGDDGNGDGSGSGDDGSGVDGGGGRGGRGGGGRGGGGRSGRSGGGSGGMGRGRGRGKRFRRDHLRNEMCVHCSLSHDDGGPNDIYIEAVWENHSRLRRKHDQAERRQRQCTEAEGVDAGQDGIFQSLVTAAAAVFGTDRG